MWAGCPRSSKERPETVTTAVIVNNIPVSQAFTLQASCKGNLCLKPRNRLNRFSVILWYCVTVYDCVTISSSFRDELRMNVNQHTPMASPYGQPQPGYGQPGYAPLDGGYPAPYPPYNGPASAYQSGAPPQGNLPLLVQVHVRVSELRNTRSAVMLFSRSQSHNLGVSFYLLPAM